MKGRVTVAVASREWAVGGKPTREPAVKKTLKLREEIAWCESRTLPVAPVIGPVGATLGSDECTVPIYRARARITARGAPTTRLML